MPKEITRFAANAPAERQIFVLTGIMDRCVAGYDMDYNDNMALLMPGVNDLEYKPFTAEAINLEELINADVQFAILRTNDPADERLKQMEDVGITVVCVFPLGFEGIVENLQLYGGFFGEEVKTRAQELIDYQNETMDYVKANAVDDDRTMLITWSMGDGTFRLQANDAEVVRIAKMAGANMVYDEARYVEVSMEQILEYDADIVINYRDALAAEVAETQAAADSAAVVVRRTFTTPWTEHTFLEPESSVAHIGEDGRLTIVSAAQDVYHNRKSLARILAMDEADIRVRSVNVGGGMVGIVTVNWPSALNALNRQVLAQLEAVFDVIPLGATRCVVLTGAGEKAFVAGADIAELLPLNKRDARAFATDGNAVLRKIETFPLPVIAAINGYALGGGCELALACDIRLAAENAVFALPEVGLGVIPGFGGTQRLARVIGVAKAKEMLYTTGKVRAGEALGLGLVNAIYPAGQLMDEAIKLAGKIATNAPLAVRAAQKAVNDGLQADIDTALALEAERFTTCFESKDQQNAMAAFLDKRVPEPFTGE